MNGVHLLTSVAVKKIYVSQALNFKVKISACTLMHLWIHLLSMLFAVGCWYSYKYLLDWANRVKWDVFLSMWFSQLFNFNYIFTHTSFLLHIFLLFSGCFLMVFHLNHFFSCCCCRCEQRRRRRWWWLWLWLRRR